MACRINKEKGPGRILFYEQGEVLKVSSKRVMVGWVVIRILFSCAVFEMHVGHTVQMLDMNIGVEVKAR